jgi:hypothetical protein
LHLVGCILEYTFPTLPIPVSEGTFVMCNWLVCTNRLRGWRWCIATSKWMMYVQICDCTSTQYFWWSIPLRISGAIQWKIACHILTGYSVSMMIVSLSVRYGTNNFSPCLIYPWKRSHMYPLNRRLGTP